MKIKLLILLLVLLTSGCSQYWFQEGKTFDECKRAHGECFADLQKRSDFSNPTMDYEMKFLDDCMAKKNYREATQEQLPLDAKRQEPDSSFHWRMRGIAGLLKK